MKSAIFGVLGVLSLCAADNAGEKYWTSGELTKMDQALVAKMNGKSGANVQLVNKPSHNTIMIHRTGSGAAEIHEKLGDILIVRSGEGAVLVGGKSINPRPAAPGETRGERVEGGVRYELKTGDVIYIPVGVPHQILVEKGKELNALVVKMEEGK